MQGLGIREQGSGTTMRVVRTATGLGAMAAMLVLAGCRQDMHDQPKFIPQRGTEFYADGRSARPQVENTVARGQMHEDAYFYTGLNGGAEGNTYPLPVTLEVLQRGQERYNVYCTPCHSRVGNGVGMIVQRGYSQAGNLHSQRLQEAPLGHFFNVISNGYGAMLNYASQVQPRDRWAIVAYIRALQYSENASVTDLPAESRARVPAVGAAPLPAQANQPIAPRDSDFQDFPAKPATPSGVPGAHGAGAVKTNQPGSQPER